MTIPREVTDRQRAQQMTTSEIAARLNEIEDRPGLVRAAAPPAVHQEWRALLQELKTREAEEASSIRTTLALIQSALTGPRKTTLTLGESRQVRGLLARLEDHLTAEPEKEEQHV